MASHVDIKYSPKWIMILFYLIRMKWYESPIICWWKNTTEIYSSERF
jgi:hypothetical protein